MSIVATMLQNLRDRDLAMSKNTLRIGLFGALGLFLDESREAGGIITPSLRKKAWNSAGRTLQIPVWDPNSNITVTTSRTCVIADAENTSKLYTVVFGNVSSGFTMVPNLYDNNEFSYEDDWIMKYRTMEDKLGDALDVLAITALGTAQTQVFAQQLGYTVTGNSVQVPYAKRVNIFGDVKGMMRANRYRGDGLRIVGNAGCEAVVRNLQIFGGQNAQNLDREFAGNRLYYTNNVANAEAIVDPATTFSGAFYAVAPGMVGFLSRPSRAERNATKTRVGHEWGTEVLPGLGMEFGFHYYESVGDMSSIASTASADMVCDKKEHFGFSLDVAFITAYNASISTIANPIIHADIISSDNPTIAMSVNQLS